MRTHIAAQASAHALNDAWRPRAKGAQLVLLLLLLLIVPCTRATEQDSLIVGAFVAPLDRDLDGLADSKLERSIIDAFVVGQRWVVVAVNLANEPVILKLEALQSQLPDSVQQFETSEQFDLSSVESGAESATWTLAPQSVTTLVMDR